MYASTLTSGLSAPTPNTPETHQKLSKMAYHDDWLSSFRARRGGRRQLGETAFCKHYMNFPITSWDYAAILNIKNIKARWLD